MKNTVLIVILVVLLGVLAGIALLLGVSSTVQMAMSPIMARLNQVEATQKLIVQRIGESGAMSSQLSSIESQLKSIQDKFGGNAPAAPEPPAEDFTKVYDIPLGTSPIKGKADAPITIVEFSDLQCPFCARFHPVFTEAMNAFPDKVRLVLKHFPLYFHPNAKPAAKWAFAAHEQGKYYDMVQLLLENGADVSEGKVKEYAQKLGLNYDKLNADMKANDAQYEQRITDDMNLGQQVDVQGTPSYFINGKKTRSRDVESLKAEINQILSAPRQ
jgi:protein-disulfide isomerase